MSFQILPFSVFRVIAEGISPITELRGSQCIYPESIQKILINTLLSDDKSFCFSAKNLCLHPSFTYPMEIMATLPNNTIFVSEEFYYQYFEHLPETTFLLNLIYNIPKTKRITLKRLEGNFPKDDSLNDLLTIYLEQSLIVNLGQQFTVGELKFEIHEIIPINCIPKKNVEERLQEMDLSIRYNENITEKKAMYSNCSNCVYNYNWMYHTKDKGIVSIGFVGQLEVEVDFVITEPPPELPPVKELIPTPELPPVEELIPTPEVIPVLSKEELRRRRLAHLS